MQASELWQQYFQRYWVKDKFTELGRPHQNPAERSMAVQKEKLKGLMIQTRVNPRAWCKAAQYVAYITVHTATKRLGFCTIVKTHNMEMPNISGLVVHKFWDKVYYIKSLCGGELSSQSW